MKFLKLTDPSGKPVWIAMQWVTAVQSPLPGDYLANAHALIAMGANKQAVTEYPEDIVEMIEAQE